MTEVIIYAAGIIAFLLLYFAFKLGEEDSQKLLKFILIAFFFIILTFMGKGVIDEKTVCYSVINQTVATNTSINTTTDYTYGDHCITDTNTTPNTFYKTIMKFSWIMATVLLIYIFKLFFSSWQSLMGKK